MSGFCQLWLTCANKPEADKIAASLLEKKLVACAKQIGVSSQFHWQGKIDSDSEVLLLMESREDLFLKIEEELAKIHSYDTFVLTSTPITNISKKAKDWLNGNLKGKQ